MENAGLISIVVPCYGGERFLAEALESCLEQTYRRIEVIVVDDASPDSCARIAEAYALRDPRLRVVRRDANGGVSRAFNSGFEVAQGSYFTRLAQDDIFRPDAIKIMKQCMDEQPDVGLVACDMQLMDKSGEIIGYRRIRSSTDGTSSLGDILEAGVGLCFMWRRSVWENVGGFNPKFDAAEDYEYTLRIARRYRVCRAADQPALLFRIHDNMGSNRFHIRQQLAIQKARARHCGSLLEARRHRSDGFFEVSYARRADGRFVSAAGYGALAIAHWPFSRRNYRSFAAACLRRGTRQGG